MEHREVEALLELAAAEPAGFARLAAGDTAEAAAVAGHLAGCPSCASVYEGLARSAGVIRDAVGSLPPADLRERTLARVAGEGRLRGPAAAAPEAVGPAPEDAGPEPTGLGATPAPARRSSVLPWAAALAAVLVIAVAGVAGWWWTAGRLGDSEATVASLTRVAAEAGRIATLPDAKTVGLGGDGASGWLIFSVTGGEMAVETAGLPEPGPAEEYRCWVEVDGQRTVLGRMWIDGEVAWWVGPAAGLSAVGDEATFGVSLVDVEATEPGKPVLVGEL